MSTIIKATDRGAGVHGVAFNFDDMSVKADEYLVHVRAEATAIVEAARKEVTAIREQAEDEGRRAGQQAVAEMVQKQLAEQLDTLMPALRRVIRDIHHAKQAWLTHWEKSAVHVATAIAGRLVRRELSQTPEITIDLVREALELAAGSSRLQIQMNPQDLKTLAPQVQALVRELCPLAESELTADEKITPGGCRVETGFGAIDQQLETQLARIEEELT